MISYFRIDEFDDDAVGMYVCKVDIHGKQIEGYVRAEIYGLCTSNLGYFNFKSFQS